MVASSREPHEVAEAIAALVRAPAGTRPLRTAVPAGSIVEKLNDATAPFQRALIENRGLSAFLPAPNLAAVS